MTENSPQNFIILPARGLRASGPQADFLAVLGAASSTRMQPFGRRRLPRPELRVLDSIAENSAKLVQMSPAEALALRTQEPGVRIVPEVFFRTAKAPQQRVRARARRMAARTRLVLRLVSAAGANVPVVGALVVAFTDFANRIGAEGTTDRQGKVALDLGKLSVKVQRLYVYPPRGFWGRYAKNITLASGQTEQLQPLKFPVADGLAHFVRAGTLQDGKGIKVAVIDTGIGPHADIVLAGGENTVTGERPADSEDNGLGHGTHVGGIVAARGKSPSGRRGVAPGVQLFNYRVFAKNTEHASNFAIAKALDRARQARVDLINLSLGGGPSDPAISSAIADARAEGIAVVAAAGNDDRSPVSFPGSDPRALAVSAMGRVGAFPKTSVETADIARPFGTDRQNFIAAFSNIGPEIAVTAPGVGIVSAVPGGYATMSGTSMASPLIAGLAARLLGKNASIRKLPRDQARSDAILQMLLAAAKSLGFGASFEGRGFPG